jgi:KaiC/GvpD/RAD55 family RecA-like ATPase
MQSERIDSGIPGFNELINGGLIPQSQVLLSGESGTGKTIFSLQYLLKGAMNDEPGLYITLDEPEVNLAWNMRNFGWDFDRLAQDKMFAVYHVNVFKDGNVFEKINTEMTQIEEEIESMGAKRVVIDSITAFSIWTGDNQLLRLLMSSTLDLLRRKHCTSLLPCEALHNEASRFGVEDFLCDAVVMLYTLPQLRALRVKKMRGTMHDKALHPYEITEHGITIDPQQQILWEAIKANQ